MDLLEYEKERVRSVHLNIIIVLTVCVAAVSFSAVSLGWEEVWMTPPLIGAAAAGWVLHIRESFTPEARLWFYAGASLAALILEGVQPASIFDFAISVVLAMALFSQADNLHIIRLCFFVYIFLLSNQIMLLVTGRGLPMTDALVAELLVHTLVVFAVYRIAMYIVRSRKEDEKTEALRIKSLREMQQRTEDFLTNVSHELRTPINAVTGIASVMMSDARTNASAERAGHIFAAGRHLTDQVEDLLDYTEIDTGRLTIVEEPYMISSLVDDVASGCSFYEKEDAERITFDVAEGIPESLWGGGKWVKKLLRHQIRNALQMTDSEEILVSIYGRERDYGINLCMDVRHRGGTVSRRELTRILGVTPDKSNAVHPVVNANELELRIIYGLAHAMGGFVRLTSTKEEGTRLHVSVPQRVTEGQRQLTEHRVTRVRHESGLTAADHAAGYFRLPKGLCALVVDDEPMNLIVAEGMLSKYGMVVDTAGSGEEAIQKVREAWYDVIFMDHMMPVMDGVEAAHKIRDILTDQERDTRIVALTANAVSGAREMFLREGFDAFVAKPIVSVELERELKGLSLKKRRGGKTKHE